MKQPVKNVLLKKIPPIIYSHSLIPMLICSFPLWNLLLFICIYTISTNFTDSGLQKLSNFDVDLMDSTVLACVLIAYCPFLIDTHFEQLYTHPSSPEQCSHNAVLFVSALQYIGIDYDIQPTDLCSANPVYMILFVIHLYERMSAFKPKKTLTFETVLGESVNQQVNGICAINYVPQ